MLGRYKQQVEQAEGRRRQASARLANTGDRWQYQKKIFFSNPVNLLLPFTAGALLASRGSATKQVVGWGRLATNVGKLVLAALPIINSMRKVAVNVKTQAEKPANIT